MIFPDRFKGKTVIVSGGAQGIGKGVVLRMAQEGAQVVLADKASLAEETAFTAKEGGLEVNAVLADLETYEGFEKVVAFTLKKYGTIDILINNVGGTIWAKPYAHYAEHEIEKEVRRSLFPTLWGCRAVLPAMLKQGKGAIVNISSIATRGINRVPYAAAKGGVNAITASLAFEYAESNIRVNGIATGGTEAPPRIIPRNDNEQTEQEKIWYSQIVEQTQNSSLMKRYGTIEEQVGAILFLASDEASYITGVTLPVSGGDMG